MGDIKFEDLSVEEINKADNRVIIKAGGQSYSFFQTKKDGQKSRAQSDFEKLGVAKGNIYSFGITENTKTNPDGKTITFRNICLISESRNKQSSAN